MSTTVTSQVKTATRINARLTGPLAGQVEQMCGENGLYKSPSDYIRELIQRDIARQQGTSDANIHRQFEERLSDAYVDLRLDIDPVDTADLASDLILLDSRAA